MVDTPGSTSSAHSPRDAYARKSADNTNNQQQLLGSKLATTGNTEEAAKQLSALAGCVQGNDGLSPADKKKVQKQRNLKLSSSLAALRKDVSALKKEANSVQILPFPPEPKMLSPAMLAIALYTLQSKFQSSRLGFVEKKIQNTKASILSQDKDKIKKWLAQMKASSASDTGALVGKIFGWIAVALTFVAAAIVTVVSGGVAGACMFVAAGIMLGFMIFQEAHGMEAVGNALHLSDHQKMIMNLCISAVVAVITLVLCAPSGIGLVRGGMSFIADCIDIGAEVGADAASAAGGAIETTAEGVDAAETIAVEVGDGAEATTELANEVSEEAEALGSDTDKLIESSVEDSGSVSETQKSAQASVKASTKAKRAIAGLLKKLGTSGKSASKIATKKGFGKFMISPKLQIAMAKMQGVTQIGTGVASVASGAADIESATFSYEASNLAAESKDLDAETTRLLGIMDQEKKRIKEILQIMQSETSVVIKILDSSSSATRSTLV